MIYINKASIKTSIFMLPYDTLYHMLSQSETVNKFWVYNVLVFVPTYKQSLGTKT